MTSKHNSKTRRTKIRTLMTDEHEVNTQEIYTITTNNGAVVLDVNELNALHIVDTAPVLPVGIMVPGMSWKVVNTTAGTLTLVNGNGKTVDTSFTIPANSTAEIIALTNLIVRVI